MFVAAGIAADEGGIVDGVEHLAGPAVGFVLPSFGIRLRAQASSASKRSSASSASPLL